MTIYYLTTAAAAIPLSRVGDKFGYVNVMLVLTVVCCILYLAQFFVNNFVTLLIFRAVSGFFVSGTISNRNTMNRVLSPAADSKKFIQKIVIVMNTATLVAPLISGLIIDYLRWNYLFIFCFAIALVSIATLLFFTNPTTKQNKVKFDIAGCIFLMIAVGSFCLIFTMISEKGYYIALGCLVVSSLSTIAFYYTEKR